MLQTEESTEMKTVYHHKLCFKDGINIFSRRGVNDLINSEPLYNYCQYQQDLLH